MKPKILQLLTMFLMIILFSSSKENSTEATVSRKFRCVPETESTLQGSDKKATEEEAIAAYPIVLAPGSYMFRY